MYIYMLHIYTVIHAYLFIYKAPKTSPDRIGVYKRETIRAHPHFSERSWQDQPQRLWLPIQAGWTWNHWNHELQIALNFGTLNHPVSRVNDLCRPFHSRLRLSQSMQSQERSFATALTRIQLLAYINMDAKTKSSSRVSDMIFVPVNQFFRGKTTIPHHSTSKRATMDH